MTESINWQKELRVAITKFFEVSDIKTLCHDLDVDFENLSGDIKTEIVISLIDRFNNQGRIPELIEYCSEFRPNVPWDQIADAAKEEKSKKRIEITQVNSSNSSSRALNPQTIGIVVAVVLIVIFGAYLAFRPDQSESTAVQATDTPLTQPATETAVTSIPLAADATDEPTPVATEVLPTPTDEPTPEPTAILAVEEPTPTITFPDGQLIELHYNPNSFYLYNPSSDRISVRAISFEALDDAERPLSYGMAGYHWADVYNFVDGGACYAIEPFGVEGAYLNPAFCLAENARETPTKDDDIVFWIERPGVVAFSVLWDNVEIARCPVGTNVCDIYVPMP